MEITSLKSYKSAFSFMKNVMLTVVILCVLVMITSICLSYYYVNKHTQSIWILDQKGGVYMGESQKDMSDEQRIWEYKNHILMFYNSMFSFDQYSFKENVEKGLHLIGNSGKEILSNYQKQELSRRLKESNVKVSVELSIDSIQIDFSKRPYKVYVNAKQIFEAPTGKSERRLYSQFVLMDLDKRSKYNPHKVLIDDFLIVDDSIIQ